MSTKNMPLRDSENTCSLKRVLKRSKSNLSFFCFVASYSIKNSKNGLIITLSFLV